MKIGVITAMLEEINLIRKDLQIKSQETIGMRDYYSGTLYGKDVVLVFSRWGKVASASTVTTLIEQFGVDIVVFTGVAGAAAKDLKVGDIVVADRLVQHDMDLSAIPNIHKFVIPLLGKSYFDVEEMYVRKAKESAEEYIDNVMLGELGIEKLNEFNIDRPKVVVGTIASGDQFIADREKILNLSRQIENLKCVEMEGAAVAQVCFEHGVPFIVVRVISDNADESANINFDKFIGETASYFTHGAIARLIREL